MGVRAYALGPWVSEVPPFHFPQEFKAQRESASSVVLPRIRTPIYAAFGLDCFSTLDMLTCTLSKRLLLEAPPSCIYRGPVRFCFPLWVMSMLFGFGITGIFNPAIPFLSWFPRDATSKFHDLPGFDICLNTVVKSFWCFFPLFLFRMSLRLGAFEYPFLVLRRTFPFRYAAFVDPARMTHGGRAPSVVSRLLEANPVLTQPGVPVVGLFKGQSQYVSA